LILFSEHPTTDNFSLIGGVTVSKSRLVACAACLFVTAMSSAISFGQSSRVDRWSTYLDPEVVNSLPPQQFSIPPNTDEFAFGAIRGPAQYDTLQAASFSSDPLGCYGCSAALPSLPDIDWETELMLYVVHLRQIEPENGAPVLVINAWDVRTVNIETVLPPPFPQVPIPVPVTGPTLSFSSSVFLPGGDFSGIFAAGLHTVSRSTPSAVFATEDFFSGEHIGIAELIIVPEPSTVALLAIGLVAMLIRFNPK
jgi:hypothetical protein